MWDPVRSFPFPGFFQVTTTFTSIPFFCLLFCVKIISLNAIHVWRALEFVGNFNVRFKSNHKAWFLNDASLLVIHLPTSRYQLSRVLIGCVLSAAYFLIQFLHNLSLLAATMDLLKLLRRFDSVFLSK